MKNAGYSLIEVLITITILSLGLLGIASLTVGIIRGNKFSNELSTATSLAQHKMEKIKGLGYSGTPPADFITTEDYNTIIDYPLYKRLTSIEADSPDKGMKTIIITVYWDKHSIKFQTILGE
ncbi:type IV pilus assembly protein PilV [Candidatus Magnetomoraceae bacterium gMMP-15]